MITLKTLALNDLKFLIQNNTLACFHKKSQQSLSGIFLHACFMSESV